MPLLDVIKNGESYEEKEVKLTLHGQDKIIISSATPLINAEGDAVGAVAVLRERKTRKESRECGIYMSKWV